MSEGRQQQQSLVEAELGSAEVESALDRRMLGEYREKIIGEYSKLLLAEHVVEASRMLEGGPLPGRLMEQRTRAEQGGK